MSLPKNSQKLSRDTLLPKLADYVLEYGLNDASLRPLAKAAGTSDRMLIYHFGSKDRLIADLLEYIAALYSASLDVAMGQDRAETRQEVISRVLTQTRGEQMRPFMVLWWEIVAGAARGNANYAAAAEAMMKRLLGWLEEQMPVDDPNPTGGARYLLTLIEGTLMLSAVGQARIAREGLLASDFAGGLASDR